MTMQEADAKCSELFRLMKPHVSTNVMQRVNMYVVQAADKKLPEFIASAEAELKGRIIGELIEIVMKGEWDKLPVVPNGQASGKAPTAPTPAPKPVVVPVPAVVLPTPAGLGGQLPVPKPKLIEVPAPTVVIEPVVTVTVKDKPVFVAEEEKPEPQVEADPMAIIAAQLAKLTKPAKPGMSEADVRRTVRHELAVVFKSISEVLAK
jgi:hypothetical protein